MKGTPRARRRLALPATTIIVFALWMVSAAYRIEFSRRDPVFDEFKDPASSEIYGGWALVDSRSVAVGLGEGRLYWWWICPQPGHVGSWHIDRTRTEFGIRRLPDATFIADSEVRFGIVELPLWTVILCLTLASAYTRFRCLVKDSHPHCLNCEYDLTGNRSGRCPECGAPLASGGSSVSLRSGR